MTERYNDMAKKLRYMSIRLSLLTATLLFSLTQLFCVVDNYPSQEEIDVKLNRYKLQQNKSEKISLLRNLLSEMKSPRNSADEKLLEEFLLKLVMEYRGKTDESILIAMDSTAIDAGFANYVCSFYSDLASEENFKSRYSKVENRPAIERCVGISFSNEDLKSKFGK